MKRKKLLVVGSIPDESNLLNYGGATVLMKNYLDYLASQSEYEYRFVQNNRYSNLRTRQRSMWRNYSYFFPAFLWRLFGCDIVMFNFSDHGTIYYFPLLSKIARLAHKKVVLRKFGGSFEFYIKKIGQTQLQRALDAIRQTDLIFFETQQGITHLQQLIGKSDNIHWFPNVRKASTIRKNPSDFRGRCVFMSHINKEKGIEDLIAVSKLLPSNYTLDIYGEIKEDKYRNINFNESGITYHGVVSSEQVLKTLVEYDLLLLPSYREGYPGIIIEAMSVGIPCVSTYAGGIPEIVEDGYNGRLVIPGDVDAIKQAILSINATNYSQYSGNALKKFEEEFESDKTNKRILEIIMH